MQTITLNGLEIQFEDGIELAIEDHGKRIVVKAKPAIATIEHHHHYGNGYYPPIYTPAYPAPVWSPFVSYPVCTGLSTDQGPGIPFATGMTVTVSAETVPGMTFSTQNIN